jgi:hypothetical protein
LTGDKLLALLKHHRFRQFQHQAQPGVANMRNVICGLAIAAALSGLTAAAQEGQVPRDTLSAMGLSDLAPLSDAQGQEIKGRFVDAHSISASALPFTFNVSQAHSFNNNNFAFATTRSRSQARFGLFGFGFFGPFPFGFGGFGLGGHAGVRSAGSALALGN